MFGATANEPDLLHATGFDAPDPVGAVRFPGGRTLLVVGSMELGRARRQSRECVEVARGHLGLSDYRPNVLTRGLYYRGVE